jgi:predicted nucleic acid-binding protein
VNSDVLVVLDACVLVPAALRDTLLRCAEEPRLYLPRWSEEIIAEMVRTLENEIGLATEKTAHLVSELRKHFGEAWVTGYETLLGQMANDPKDRHVLAATVRCGAQAIVTYNRRHFPQEALEPWGIEVQGPSTFLKGLYELDADLVIDKLQAQADNLGRSLSEQLKVLKLAVPSFVAVVAKDLRIDIEE